MTKPKVIKEVAGDLVCIHLDIHIWSGRRHLTKEDLIQANEEFRKLPEKDLATLGAVKICDPEKIKQFQAYKNQAEHILSRAGLPFMKGTGVPRAKYPEVYAALIDLEGKYKALVDLFLKEFEDGIEKWKKQHLKLNPQFAPLFRDLPTAAHVGGRLSFDFHPVAIAPPSGDPLRPDLDAKFEGNISGLKGELINEVAVEATAFVESLYKQKDGVVKQRDFVTPKTLGPLQRAADKLEAFAFIDPEIGPLAEFMQNLLSDIPDEGRIDGMKLIQLASIARQMQDQRSISRLSALAMDGWTPGQVVSGRDEAATQAAEAAQPTAETETATVVGGVADDCDLGLFDYIGPPETTAPLPAQGSEQSTAPAMEVETSDDSETCWL